MKCAWQALINLLPIWMRDEVDRRGKENLLEIRLRINQPPECVTTMGRFSFGKAISLEDLTFCVNIASRYSPWSAATVAEGYITAPGGHRIGICGDAVVSQGRMSGIRTPSSLCIRVSRDFLGISATALQFEGSILIIGAPGCGKTTLLRDLIRQRSDEHGEFISVVDERQEIFPYVNNQPCYYPGQHTDILYGCSKEQGIMRVLRNMTPQTIAVDEITADEDCKALLHAGWCGVNLLATAHAGSRCDLESRPIYRPLLENKLFDMLLIIHKDKTWLGERLNI